MKRFKERPESRNLEPQEKTVEMAARRDKKRRFILRLTG